jgi:23S rRNA pseudouridine2605 synthase
MIQDYGVQLEDGPSKLQLYRIREGHETNWQVTMHEGRNRQIRRTFASLGYTVTGLHRTQFGNYHLNELVAKQFLVV